MSVNIFNNIILCTPRSLKVAGILGGVCALVLILVAMIAYLAEQPDFSMVITYLSEIRVTPVWPQIGLFSIPTH